MAAFTLDSGVKMQLLDLINEKVPEKLDINVKTDLDALYGILEDEMKNRNITENIKKIVAVLQNIEGKRLWNLTCVLSGMEILRSHVDDETRSVLKMEKFSMMDLIKKVPGKALAGLPESKAVRGNAQPPKNDISNQIKQIDKMEEVLEKKKAELKSIAEKADSLDREKKELKRLEKKKK